MMNRDGGGGSPGPGGLGDVGGADGAVSLRAPAEAPASRSWAASFLADLAPHDWIVLAYFGLLFVGVLFGDGPDRPLAARIVVEHILVLTAGLALTRGAILARGSFASVLLYRVTLFVTFLSSYLELRLILPACSSRAVDASLYALDLRVFHFEPAVAWDRFVNPLTTEWFAFFYFGYFFLLAAFVLPFMFFGRNMAILARFSTAIFITFCCGHLLYILVPGYGPYRYLASTFAHPLDGGLFWGLVRQTVADAGAQKDIFPSLHTAVPSTFTLLAFRYRREFRPFRLAWPFVAFCTSQIIIATMFLRWHYLIDICAGLTLATLSVGVSDRLVRRDDARRERLGLPAAWTRLAFRR